MSLVPFTFNVVELQVVTVDSKDWCRAKEVCKTLGYKRGTDDVPRTHCSGENPSHKYALKGGSATAPPLEWPKDSQKYDLYINEEGLKKLVLTSQQPEAPLLAETFDINVHKHKYMSKENDSIEFIMRKFDGEKMIGQFHIVKYRIDLYFSAYKLAISCDEFGHNNDDVSYEVNRQKYIEEQLQCQFVQYNPNARDFDVVQVLKNLV